MTHPGGLTIVTDDTMAARDQMPAGCPCLAAAACALHDDAQHTHIIGHSNKLHIVTCSTSFLPLHVVAWLCLQSHQLQPTPPALGMLPTPHTFYLAHLVFHLIVTGFPACHRYRTREEMVAWRARDPVVRFRHWLVANAWWDEEREKQLRHATRQQVRLQHNNLHYETYPCVVQRHLSSAAHAVRDGARASDAESAA